MYREVFLPEVPDNMVVVIFTITLGSSQNCFSFFLTRRVSLLHSVADLTQ